MLHVFFNSTVYILTWTEEDFVMVCSGVEENPPSEKAYENSTPVFK